MQFGGARVKEPHLFVQMLGLNPVVKAGLVKYAAGELPGGGPEVSHAFTKLRTRRAGPRTGRDKEVKSLPGHRVVGVDDIDQILRQAERLILEDAAISISKGLCLRRKGNKRRVGLPEAVGIGIFTLAAREIFGAKGKGKGAARNHRLPKLLPYRQAVIGGPRGVKPAGDLILVTGINKTPRRSDGAMVIDAVQIGKSQAQADRSGRGRMLHPGRRRSAGVASRKMPARDRLHKAGG